ncbi:MAG: 50S ribosomal protein L28 [Bacteroidales bacterium]|jgi:large subunit ribosomal protein L28|nr:50S ribosomal protein L28 [Bacteroidales bacterium]MCI2145645.1 50S ribosomal protein L28 [Bacteroidales bacterium]
MSKICQVTGRRAQIGKNVSHSKNHTARTFDLNLKEKKFWLEDEKRFVTLKTSVKGMRNIYKHGLKETIAEAQKKGYVKIV